MSLQKNGSSIKQISLISIRNQTYLKLQNQIYNLISSSLEEIK